MRGGLSVVLTGAMLFAALGCSTPDPAPASVARRLSYSGYSVLPPQGAGWLRGTPAGADLAFFRTGEAPGQRFLLVAAARPAPGTFATPQAFLEAVIRQQEGEADPRRFHLLQESVHLDPAAGAYCVRTSASAEDRRSKTRMVLDATSLVCLHPTAPRLMITVAYSALHPPGKSVPGFAEEGERFIDSLRFFDPP